MGPGQCGGTVPRLELLSSVRGAQPGPAPSIGALSAEGYPQPSCPHPGADTDEEPCGKEPLCLHTSSLVSEISHLLDLPVSPEPFKASCPARQLPGFSL